MFHLDPPVGLPDPQPTGNPHHHFEYSWILLWYAGLGSDHLREAQEIDQLRRQESVCCRTVTEFEREAGYQKGELQQDIEHAGLFNARSVLSFILEEMNSSPRPFPQNDSMYNGRCLRELMSDEEKLFELHRLRKLPRTSETRHCFNVLRELDNSVTLAFHRNRPDIKLVRIGGKNLCIRRRNGEKLCEEMRRLPGTQGARTFAIKVTTVWQQREAQRRAIEL